MRFKFRLTRGRRTPQVCCLCECSGLTLERRSAKLKGIPAIYFHSNERMCNDARLMAAVEESQWRKSIRAKCKTLKARLKHGS